MPTINESELPGGPSPCSNCPDYEGAIWLCGEGYLCERCFAELAGIPETDLFTATDRPLLDFEVPAGAKARAKAKLMYGRSKEADGSWD